MLPSFLLKENRVVAEYGWVALAISSLSINAGIEISLREQDEFFLVP